MKGCCEKFGGRILPLEVEPQFRSVGVVANLGIFDIAGKDAIKEFILTLEKTSVFTISSLPNGQIRVDITIPDVFGLKKQSQ